MLSDSQNALNTLTEHIRATSAAAAVIGLGYVGLPLACILARCGFPVTGVDVNAEHVATINAGQLPMAGDEPGMAELLAEVTQGGRLRATTDYADLAAAQVVLICVDTPVDSESHYPSYRSMRGALASLGKVLSAGALVIVESTLAPGTMSRVVIPELEAASGKRAGQDFYVGHCPERVTPGKLLLNMTSLSRPVGGQTPAVAEAMIALYQHYVTGDLDATDMLTAEIVKTAENTNRDVQIAFANELALICDVLGADVFRVRELVNKVPGRPMLLPGAGVGGHCIPKDPWLLVANLGDAYRPQLIPAARAVNSYMPFHVLELVRQALTAQHIDLNGARITVLGYAFREDTGDDRDSPSKYLIDALREQGAQVTIHDPYILAYQRAVGEAVRDAQVIVIMVAHRAYLSLDLALLAERAACRILVDGRHVVKAADAAAHGFAYYGVGVPPQLPQGTTAPVQSIGA